MAREPESTSESKQINQHEDARFVREMQPSRLIDLIPQVLDRVARERFKDHSLAPTPADLQILHMNLFQGLYAEPGNYRGVRTGTEFEDVTTEMGRKNARRIADRIDATFEVLKRQNYLRLPKEEYVVQLANIVHALNELKPFYYGNRMVIQIMAGHIAEYAGYNLDLLAVHPDQMRLGLDAAEHHKDLVPLREILRIQSRPMRAIMFESAISAGELPNINIYPDLKHAYGLVVEAMGSQLGKGPTSELALRRAPAR
jgi:fido (protein-threonine AMPylation protein)